MVKFNWFFYEYIKGVERDDWLIKEGNSDEMKQNPIDYEIIKQDWKEQHQYILKGKAHELSGSVNQLLISMH